MSEKASWKHEFNALWKHMQRPKVTFFILIGQLPSYLTFDEDLAHVCSRLLLFLLWRKYGYIFEPAFLRPSSCVIFDDYAYVYSLPPLTSTDINTW